MRYNDLTYSREGINPVNIARQFFTVKYKKRGIIINITPLNPLKPDDVTSTKSSSLHLRSHLLEACKGKPRLQDGLHWILPNSFWDF